MRKFIFATILLCLGIGQVWAATRTYYCEMKQGWWTTDGASVGCYALTSDESEKNAEWPGVKMTWTGTDGVWSIDLDTKYEKVVFTRLKGDGSAYWSAKTGDLTLDENNYYTITSGSAVWDPGACSGSWSKYAPTPAIAGSMNSWRPDANVFSGSPLRLTMDLPAGKAYQLKVADGQGSAWYGRNNTYDNDLVFVGQTDAETLYSGEHNMMLMTAEAGTYTFEWNSEDHKLTITYPSAGNHPSANYVYVSKDASSTKDWGTCFVNFWNTSTSETLNTNGHDPQLEHTTSINDIDYYYVPVLADYTTFHATQYRSGSGYSTGDQTLASHAGQYQAYVNPAWGWHDFVFDVTLTPNDGTISDGHAVTEYTFGTGATLPNSEYITRTGYTFGGWYGNVGLTGSAIEEISTTDNGDTTLYAKWTAKTYTITLKDNGGSGGDASVTATYDAALPSFTAASRSGFVLTGYYTSDNKKIINADGTLVASVTGYTDASSHWINDGTATLYAHWVKTISPTQDVLYRTNSDNNGWDSKDYPMLSSTSGKTEFECKWSSRMFAIQQYEIPDYAKAKTITLTLCNSDASYQQPIGVWAFPYEMPTSNSYDATKRATFISTVTTLTGNTIGSITNTFINQIGSASISGGKWVVKLDASTLKPYAYDGTTAKVQLLITSRDANASVASKYKSNNSSNSSSDRPMIEVTYIDDIQNPIYEYHYRFTNADKWNDGYPKTGDDKASFEVNAGARIYTVEQFSLTDYDPANVYTLTLHKQGSNTANLKVWNFETLKAGSTTVSDVIGTVESVTGADFSASTAPSKDPIQNVALADNKWTFTILGDKVTPIYEDENKAVVSLLIGSADTRTDYYTSNPANSSSNFPTFVKDRNRAVKLISGSTVTYYDSIQTAHADATTNDTIELLRDYEQLSPLTISTNIVLRGKTGSEVLTRGSARSRVFINISESCTIKDLVISGTDATKGAGMHPIEVKNTTADKTVAFNNVTFQKFGNDQNLNGVVAVLNHIAATFTNVTFSDCASLKPGSGDIFVAGNSRNITVSGTFTAQEGVYLQKNRRMVNSSATYSSVTLYLEDVYVHDYAAVTALPEADFSKFSIANSGWYTKYSTINGGELHAMHGTRVTLNLHGGSGTESIEVGYDSTATAVKTPATIPTVATRAGYALQGYYTAESAGTKIFNANGSPVSTVTDYTNSGAWKYADTDLTLHAQWTEVTLTFNATSTSDWGTAGNWSPTCVPTIEHDVVLAKPAVVNATNAKAKSVVIYNNGSTKTGKLTIGAGKALAVATTIQKTADGSTKTATTAADIILESDGSNGTGAIVAGEESHNTKATVQFYSKAKNDEGGSGYINQYFGIPVDSVSKLAYYGSYLRKFDVATDAWVSFDKGEDKMRSFAAYRIMRSETSEGTYEIDGDLILPGTTENKDKVLTLTHNAHLDNMFANSWTAPIDITKFDESDFVGAVATVYVFNAGSSDDYNGTPVYTGASAGNWNAMPVEAVKDAVSKSQDTYELTQIPSQQAFLVQTTDNSTHTLTLDYKKLVYDPIAENGATIIPTRAPQRTEATDLELMQLKLSAESGLGDRVLLYQCSEFANDALDNGWEAYKLPGSDFAPQLCAYSPLGEMAIAATNDVEGTVLGFYSGTQDNSYTFSFGYDGSDIWYLNDLMTQQSTCIMEGNTYHFTAAPGSVAESRFVISHTPIAQVPTDNAAINAQQSGARKVMIKGILYIVRDGRIYTVDGMSVNERKEVTL